MGLFDFIRKREPRPSLQETTLTAIDNLNAQIIGLENDPHLSDEQKAEQIALLKREIKKFSDAMGWKYDA